MILFSGTLISGLSLLMVPLPLIKIIAIVCLGIFIIGWLNFFSSHTDMLFKTYQELLLEKERYAKAKDAYNAKIKEKSYVNFRRKIPQQKN